MQNNVRMTMIGYVVKELEIHYEMEKAGIKQGLHVGTAVWLSYGHQLIR